MCKAMEDLYEEGIEKGKAEEKIQFARDLLKIEKMPPEKVAMLTRLPLEQVLTLC